jgi:hypothetical protein
MGAQNQRTKNALLLFYNEDERMRMRERETKFSPRVLLRIFNTQRSLRARREIQHKPTRLFVRPKIFPPKLRLEKSRKVNNNFAGRNSKHFP